MLQPMRPLRSATTMFWPACRAPLAASNASSIVRAASSGVTRRGEPLGRMRHPAVGAQAAHDSPARAPVPRSSSAPSGHGAPARRPRSLPRVVSNSRQPSRRPVPVRVRRVELEQDDVAPVGVGVGEAPGDVRVAADDERRARPAASRRRAAAAPAVGLVGPFERGAVPGVRHADRRGACRWRRARAPSAVSRADTASCCCRARRRPACDAHGFARPRCAAPPRTRAVAGRSPGLPVRCAAGCRRPARALGGIANGSPTTGVSHSVPRGARKSNMPAAARRASWRASTRRSRRCPAA